MLYVLLITEPTLLSFTVKLLLGPGKVYVYLPPPSQEKSFLELKVPKGNLYKYPRMVLEYLLFRI